MRYSHVVLGVLLGGLGIVAGCGRDKKKSPSPLAPEEPIYTLTVFTDSSVVGEPKSGVTTRRAGERVSYRYEPSSGFRNAVVVVDSAVATLTGSVTMNGNRQILASAEKIVVVPPEDMPAARAAEQVLTSSDKTVSYQQYMNELVRLYEQYSGEEALKRAQTVSQSVFGSADFAVIRVMQEALHGKVFDFGETSTTSSSVPPNAAALAGRSNIDVIFVNGIWVAEEEAALQALEFARAIRQTGLSAPVRVRLFYNGSALKKAGLQEYCVIKALGSALATFNAVNLVTGFVACLGNAAFQDVVEATRQLLALVSYADFGPEEEAKGLAEMIRQSRREGRAVILVGHSQGALMANQALNVLASPDRCVTAVSLAGPHSIESWGLTQRELAGLVAEGRRVGDFILRLGRNNFPRLETEITRDADRIMAETVVFPALVRLKQEWRLHSLLGSYLKAGESLKQLQTIITQQVRVLTETADCRVPSGVRIYASSGQVVAGYNEAPSDLWIVPPYTSGADTLVARIRTADGFEPVITDVALTPGGAIWGVSFDRLYYIDKETGVASEVALFTGFSGVNALTFDPSGRLYVADNKGAIAGFDLNASVPRFFIGQFGSDYGSSGDLAFSLDGRLFATVTDGSGTGFLVVVNLTNGRATPVSSEPIGFSRVWGLIFVGNVLFGLTTDPASGKGSLITIDPATGRGTFVRQLSFNASGAAASPPSYQPVP